MLRNRYQDEFTEAGCDEAGRGCLAGPVYAAAVILPHDFKHKLLNDSKQLSDAQRREVRPYIEEKAIAWAVASMSVDEIDEMNILRASFAAMHKAIAQLSTTPEFLLIDGNRFKPAYPGIPHACIIGGDGKYKSIAAASILAKTYRDDYMDALHEEFPHYDWLKNKGYGTAKHRAAIVAHGLTVHHRKSFRQLPDQLEFTF
ncbi:MAG: ribonuclease HII [Bacteroidia bacterium]|jgi:ribonuclease HII|nr:ribonuclease HII [Bacteroidia bacterium]